MIPVKDIEDGKKIATLFESLNEDDKNAAVVYLSALRDRQLREEKVGTEKTAV